MKIRVNNRESVELLLQLALSEHLEIKIKPVVVETKYLYTQYYYEIELEEEMKWKHLTI